MAASFWLELSQGLLCLIADDLRAFGCYQKDGATLA